MRTIEIFANENGNIVVKDEGKLFELNPTETISEWVIKSEKYEIITKDIWIAVPVGGGESWTVQILLNNKGNYAVFVDNADEYIGAEKVPVSDEYLKEHKFESKGVTKIG